MGAPGHAPETGRPGRAVTTRGTTAAAQAPNVPPAGYDAHALDKTILSYLATIEKSIRIAESLGTKVEQAVTTLCEQITGTPQEQAELLTTLHDRLAKANLNLVKSTDELTRLRSFLAGGPTDRKNLDVTGEVELRSLLVVAVKQLGWTVIDAGGKPIDVEAA